MVNDLTLEVGAVAGVCDFGVFTVAGVKLYWKIDLYDPDYAFGSDDPLDPSRTRRVLSRGWSGHRAWPPCGSAR